MAKTTTVTYIKFTYDLTLNPHAGPPDFIGPFTTMSAAFQHRKEFGPVAGELVPASDVKTEDLLDGHLMSPEEARAYMEARA